MTDAKAASSAQRTRRQVARAAIWTVPVIAIGATAPLAAASACPVGNASLNVSNMNYDQITLSNTGTSPITTATTITWTIQNLRNTTATLTITALSGLTASATTVAIATNGSATITFTLSNPPLAANNSVYWRFQIGGYNYNSRVLASTPLCSTPISNCLSNRGGYFAGTTCPTAAVAAARVAANAPAPLPESTEIPVKQ